MAPFQALEGRAREAQGEQPPWAHPSLQALGILGVQSPLATGMGLARYSPHLPPQMPAGLCPGGREESEAEDLGGEVVLKEHCAGAEGLGPSLTRAAHCVTSGKVSSPVK